MKGKNTTYFSLFYSKGEDAVKKAGWIALLNLTKDVLEACIDVLGFEAPERM